MPDSPRGRSSAGTDFAAYVQSDQFRADLEEAQRLVQAGDTEGLAAFASRNVEARAALAASRIRGLRTFYVKATVTTRIEATDNGEAMQELCNRLHYGVVNGAYDVNTVDAEPVE